MTNLPNQIVVYHNILPEYNGDPMCVSIKTFKQQIQYLVENRNIISIDEFYQKFKNKTLNIDDVVITFDDGYKDNIKYALPILEKYNIPATFYICTGFIENTALDCREVAERVEQGNQFTSMRLYRRKQFIRKKKIQSMKNNDGLFMNIDDLKYINNSPLFTIGAHTQNHTMLKKENIFIKLKEIYISKLKLQKWTKNKVNHFCYPYGSHSLITVLMTVFGFKTAVLVNNKKEKIYNFYNLARLPRTPAFENIDSIKTNSKLLNK